MIVVVADTSPLNYLIQIDCDSVLPALYERVLVPSAVLEKLRHPRAVAAVRAWLTRVPSWLAVEQVAEAAGVRLARLDPGERQAIQLAKRERADLLLMDEELGVRIAREDGLAVTGTLGVLLLAVLQSEGADTVIGSRYVPGGGIASLEMSRVLMSKFACLLARFPVHRNAMSFARVLG